MPGSVHTLDSTSSMSDKASHTIDPFSRPNAYSRTAPKHTGALVSPTGSTFSFEVNKGPTHAVSALPGMVQEKDITRSVSRGAPGDAALKAMANRGEKERGLTKRKSQYYGEAFAYREPNSSTRGRVSRDSVVMADLRTNVIIKDEYTFITDLSSHLSTRFQRPESSIMITVSHSACLIFGGSFDPAYNMTLTALPSQIQPTTNKRNAALTQAFMTDALGVAADRGVIKFVSVAEENLATNGQTVLGEIEALDRQQQEETGGIKRSLTSKSRKNKSMQALKERSSPVPGVITPPLSPAAPEIPIPLPPMPTEKSKMDIKAEKVQKMGRRRSFLAMFGK
ncbi:MAG: hypothetical protein M1827_006088 [Pycnora praestabilis]|nr:MAG: hypothetical protein M1827_006088 [Pycnora praestabilis]